MGKINDYLLYKSIETDKQNAFEHEHRLEYLLRCNLAPSQG